MLVESNYAAETHVGELVLTDKLSGYTLVESNFAAETHADKLV